MEDKTRKRVSPAYLRTLFAQFAVFRGCLVSKIHGFATADPSVRDTLILYLSYKSANFTPSQQIKNLPYDKQLGQKQSLVFAFRAIVVSAFTLC